MRWRISETIPEDVRKSLAGFDDLTAQLLFNRGITNSEAAAQYFDGSHSRLHDPHKLAEADKAARILADAIAAQKKIFIYGDYDVDGVCATSILFDFLFRKAGANVVPYIPSRFDEGYGMGEKGLDHILEQGGNLVITVDCGIKDKELVEKYTEKGLDFIITDHHSFSVDTEGNALLPDKALALVHPKLPGGGYPFPEICATTVIWKVIAVLCEELAKRKMQLQPCDIQEYLDLVALATVYDVMPLIDENRVIVSMGIERMRQTSNLGLREILRITNIEPAVLEGYHLGFVIGPRINATGRIEHALDGVRLFTSLSEETVQTVAKKLDELNTLRQKITQEIIDQAEAQLLHGIEGKKLLFVHGEGWAEGVVGLVAGKLTEKYNRPVLVASSEGTMVKGSARSIPSFNITEAISRSEKILLRYGGHKQAAGFTLEMENLAAFKESLETIASAMLQEEDLIPELLLDAAIPANLLHEEFILTLRKFKPYGFGNREPVFMIEDARIHSQSLVGKEKKHLKLRIQKDGQLFDVIGFGKAELYEKYGQYDSIDLAGQLDLNYWQGRASIQIKLKDIRKHDE